MEADLDTLWRILDEIQDVKLCPNSFHSFRSRYRDLESVLSANRSDLINNFQFSELSCEILELIRRALRGTLLRQIANASHDELPPTIRMFSREYFSGREKNSFLVFYFRDGNFLGVDEPGYGTLFHYDFFPRDVIGKALSIDANILYLAFGETSESKNTKISRNQFISSLRNTGNILEYKVADTFILPIDTSGLIFNLSTDPIYADLKG